MNQSESVQIFVRFLNQRYNEFKEQLENMLKTMSSNNAEAKLAASRQFLTTGSGLALTLSVSDRPAWLTKLLNNTEWYIANHNSSSANHTHVMHIMNDYDQAMNHEWLLTQTEMGVDYSFDNVFERSRTNSTILELCDAMVDTLDHMIDSCEIDSVSAINSLNQLITLINQNKSGSYFSILSSQDFITKFLKNATWMQIRKIPGVKTFKDSFEKTAKEMDSELDRLYKEIVAEVSENYDNAIIPKPKKNNVKKLVLNDVQEA